jgi:hypothetical protein
MSIWQENCVSSSTLLLVAQFSEVGMSRQWLTLALRGLSFVLVSFFGVVVNRVLSRAEGKTITFQGLQYWPFLGLGLTLMANS